MMRRALSLKISAAALGLLAAAGCEIDFVPRAEAREEWKKSYPAAADAQLAIENTAGRIVVRPGTGSTIEVIATRIAKAGSDEEAKKVLADSRIEETVTGSSVRLSSTFKGMNWRDTQYRVDYEVRAPVGIVLTLNTTMGEIDVADWEGRVEMSATNGTLAGSGLRGEVEGTTTNGKIDVRLAHLAEGGATFETTNGLVSIELPKDAKGRILARVTNGGISVDGLNVQPSPSNTRRRYEATLNGGGGPTVSVETTNGAVRVSGR